MGLECKWQFHSVVALFCRKKNLNQKFLTKTSSLQNSELSCQSCGSFYGLHLVICQFSPIRALVSFFHTLQMVHWNYSGNWNTHKRCTLYKYLPYTLQCRSVDVTVKPCKSVLHTFIPLYLDQQLNVNITGVGLQWKAGHP